MKRKNLEFQLGDILMIYRRRANLSKKDMAKRLKVSAATISNYEKNSTIPSYQDIIKLKRMLGEEFCDMLELYERGKGSFIGYIL